jgi:hypothetical protein
LSVGCVLALPYLADGKTSSIVTIMNNREQSRPPGRKSNPVPPRAGAARKATADAGGRNRRSGDADLPGPSNRGTEMTQGAAAPRVQFLPNPSSSGGSSNGRRSRWRRKKHFEDLSQGNLVANHQQMVQAEVAKLQSVMDRLNVLALPREQVQEGDLLLALLTDLNTDSSIAGALLLAKCIFLATSRPAIVISVLRAPVHNAVSYCIQYCGTPNTAGSQDRTKTVAVGEPSSPVAEHHAVCPLAQAALERGFLGARAVAQAFGKTGGPIDVECPCRWILQLSPWASDRSGQMTCHTRLLTKEHVRSICCLKSSLNKRCAPFHLKRCGCPKGCLRMLCSVGSDDSVKTPVRQVRSPVLLEDSDVSLSIERDEDCSPDEYVSDERCNTD